MFHGGASFVFRSDPPEEPESSERDDEQDED